MATISTLAVNLIARTSVFEKKMRSSRGTVKRFGASAATATATMARFAKGLLVAAGVGGMGFMLKSTMANIDATAKLADRLGIATEALGGLRHAANIAGVSSQALDKSLEIFVRRMGEVSTGSGEAKKGLELLGLSAEKMIALSPDKSLSAIADRIKGLGTQAEKAAAAYFLFGRAGQQMLNLFETGSQGLAEMQAEAEKLGLTFSRIDAAKVEAANDAITRLKASMTGLMNDVVIRLAPIIQKLTDGFVKHREAIISTTKRIALFTVKTLIVVKTIKLVGGAIRGLITLYKSLAVAQTVTLALGGPAGWATLAIGVGVATAAIVGLNKVLDGTIGKIKDITGSDGLKEEASLIEKIALKRRALAKLEAKKGGFSGGAQARFTTRFRDQINALEKRLKIVQAVKKAEEAAAKALKEQASLMEKVKLEGANIFKALMGTLDPERKDKSTIGSAQFQTIRSEFIDVAALNPRQTTEQELVKETKLQTSILAEMNQRSIGRYQA